jgi:hypothetical protein
MCGKREVLNVQIFILQFKPRLTRQISIISLISTGYLLFLV